MYLLDFSLNINFFIMIFLITKIAFALSAQNAIEIDNTIVGDPILECDAGFITLKIQTKSHFMGRIFLKGMASTGKSKNIKDNFKKNCEIRASNACQPFGQNNIDEVKNRPKYEKK